MNEIETSLIIKKARKIRGLTQNEFGNEINKSQAVVSKYEKGTVAPTITVFNHCMNIINEHDQYSTENIIKKIKHHLSSKDRLPEQHLLMTMIDYIIRLSPNNKMKKADEKL